MVIAYLCGMIVLKILVVYLLQMSVTSFVNVFNGTRLCENFYEFIKFTFLPYVLFNLKKIR